MTAPPSPHLDLDALADVLAGERDDAHLASCSSCTSRLGELRAADARVAAVLGALPPPAVPADLADRLATAIAAEEPLAPARSTVTALPASSARRRSWLPAAAAAVLLVSGAGLGYSLLGGPGGSGDSGDDSAASAGGAGSDLALNASGTDYADAAAVQDVLPGVLEGRAGPVALETGGESFSTQQDSGDGAAAPQAEAEREAEDATTAQAPAGGGLSADELARLRTPDGLADCLAALLPPDDPGQQPLALDYATYSGSPALAVLLPDPDPAKLSVFVVGPGCSRADDSLLHFFRVDAP